MPGAPLSPMLATAGPLPVGAGWSYEFKWDGVRVLASFEGGAPRLWARSGTSVTLAYPEIAPLALPPDSLLDGEMVVLDAAGRPSFTALAERMHVRDAGKAARLAGSLPVTYMVFDLLRYAGESLLDLPYSQRRARLEEVDLGSGHWMVPPVFTDGPATAAAARENSLEGVVAKGLDTPYVPGARSSDWVKVKFDRTGDYVIGGWRPGARRLGGLLVGIPGPDGGLRFRGRVGGGIGAAAEQELLSVLAPIASTKSPFAAGAVPREDARGAHWVNPELVVEVRYGNRTPDGRLRFPRFLRLRPDKTPAECVEDDDDG
ncbi:non-homologous end-joining DNA ligase [Couchioplanes caeruleus]|uniref:DNA ligase (ATP) n=2 Tax=Couchioplanes caeruleus TaxID=56438 RepID=A0A1K0FMY8_9ACTN|nr:non-homologous end-joining DNA ligase [Couchioplanes caeruleus]OJF14153.1 DNA ligase [Couchioplanes caeruleus subsp. caeruleus]ROP30649.1 bifunctional non-homologous end joining protein LigD [Couchioplanes caeruleus]